jgi:hypothetical protein
MYCLIINIINIEYFNNQTNTSLYREQNSILEYKKEYDLLLDIENENKLSVETKVKLMMTVVFFD